MDCEDEEEGEEEEDESEADEYDVVREEPRNASLNETAQRSSLLETSSTFVYLKQTPSPSAHKSASFTGVLVKKEESPREIRKPLLPLASASALGGELLRSEAKPEPPPHRLEQQPVPPQRGLSLNYDLIPSPKITPRSSPLSKAHSDAAVPSYSPVSDKVPLAERKERKERPVKERKEKVHKEDRDEADGQAEGKAKKKAQSEKGAKSSQETKSKSNQIMEIEKFARENVARHVKRGVGNQLLKRRTSLKQMLSWSKNSIKQPMIVTMVSGNTTTRGDIKTEAINCFKLIQQYMGDRTVDRKDVKPNESIAFDLITKACQRQEMRDEIYVQLCRQNTDNPKKSSVVLGLELMAICLSYFPPSVKFSPYLASFLTNNPLKEATVNDKEDKQGLALIEFCYHRLFRGMKVRGIHLNENGCVAGSGGSVYCRKPVTSREIDMVKEAIERGFPGIFGESLDAQMVCLNFQCTYL